MRLLLFIGIAGICFPVFGQPHLKPSIGLTSFPADQDPICQIPSYTGSFDQTGLAVDDTIPDFTLYDVDGIADNASNLLTSGKPLLLISSSYTCPVFRNHVPLINQLENDYGNLVDIRIIYTVEAHPDIDISPYFGFVNTGAANTQEGILYRQPTTYGERKTIVNEMLNNMSINVPVLIDGPCNEWWSEFGPAPNNAYLIRPDGRVFSKHPWLDRYPNDIECDLEELLFGLSCTPSGTYTGSFTFSVVGDTLQTGPAGTTLYGYGLLENNSPDTVLIEIARLTEDLPQDWSSSMCLDACLPTTTDYTTLLLEPGGRQSYTMYFYTGSSPESGAIQMGFRNVHNPQNRYVQWFFGETEAPTAVEEAPEPITYNVKIAPNPISQRARILIPDDLWNTLEAGSRFQLFNAQGNLVKRIHLDDRQTRLDRAGLPSGIYFFEIRSVDRVYHSGKLVFR